jgi:FkbM family methyltransferase
VAAGLDRLGVWPTLYAFWLRAGRSMHHRRSLRFYSQFVRPGNLVFDVGANLGDRTQLFLELGAKVVAIEPNPACTQELQRRFGGNSNVIVVESGVADQVGTAQLAICEESPAISTLSDKWKSASRHSKRNKWSKTCTINLTTLDLLIECHGRPVFCKIDVEGFEEQVLKGLTQPIPCISFEFLLEFMGDTQRCIDRLCRMGRSEFNYSRGESMKLAHNDWMSSEVLSKALEIDMADADLWGDVYVRFYAPLRPQQPQPPALGRPQAASS